MDIEKFYSDLKQKFIDKGRTAEFYLLVMPFPFQDNSRTPTLVPYWVKEEDNIKNRREIFLETVEMVYFEEWDYWNTWIDYQQYYEHI